jgi:hypothetical protein
VPDAQQRASSSTDWLAGYRRHSPDLLACLFLVGCALALFRLSLFQGWSFIGDSDRLNTVLNVRLFEVLSILQYGTVPTWSEHQFMGYGIVGLHWMLPGAPPIPQLLSLLPLTELYHALAALAAGLLAAAMLAAYWALGAYSTGPLQRLVGALLYGTGMYTIHKLTQLDISFAALVAPPIFVRLVRDTRRETAARTFLGMAICWALLVVFTVLQEIAYIALLWGAYALFRTLRLRDPWPLVAAGLAFVAGVAIGLPRVVTIAAEIPFVTRTSTNIQTTAAEALRYFGDGLLGRTQGENGMLRGNPINLHEGVQLLNSALAAWGVVALGLLLPSRWLRFWGVALVVVLSVALNAYFRPFYDLEGFGLRGVAYPSRELRTVVINVILIGLPLWLAASWLAARPAPARALAMHVTPASRDLPAVSQDVPFFFGFVVVGLAMILIPEARAILYYGFMKMDFLHSRISVAMTFPLAALSVVLLNRFVPSPLTVPLARTLGLGVALGVALWVGREAVAGTFAAQVGPAVEALRPRRLLTLEVVRVLSSLFVMIAALGVVVRRASARWLGLVGGVLLAWMSLETLASADFRMSGPPATQQARPFSDLDYMQVAPGAMRIPSAAERVAVRERLEADQYRVVLLQDQSAFLALVEPHLAAFWDLRLVEGYSTGLPRRLGTLPWGEAMVASHHLDLHGLYASADLPWRLLGALNVKYVVKVDRSLWYNPAPGGADPPLDAARLEVWENPHPVTPRAFFAARISPAGSDARLPGDDGRRPAPKDPPIEDLTRHSVSEGITAERTFSTDGVPVATFAGDRVHVRLEPAPAERFLVLNELYHPAWQAEVDGVPTIILPTNVVMRGIVVPAGARQIELRYDPFIYTPAGRWIMFAGVLALPLVAWGLRCVDLVPQLPFLVRRRRTPAA